MGESHDQPRVLTLGEEEVAEAILQYLAERPEAMDTLDGIAEWWVRRQRLRVEIQRVARVLGRLTEDGLLECLGSGPDRRYRLRRPQPGPDPA
jgi:hypothetical protein